MCRYRRVRRRRAVPGELDRAIGEADEKRRRAPERASGIESEARVERQNAWAAARQEKALLTQLDFFRNPPLSGPLTVGSSSNQRRSKHQTRNQRERDKRGAKHRARVGCPAVDGQTAHLGAPLDPRRYGGDDDDTRAGCARAHRGFGPRH